MPHLVNTKNNKDDKFSFFIKCRNGVKNAFNATTLTITLFI